MAEPGAPRQTVKFDRFGLDLATGELRRDGMAVRLERLPADLLVLLVLRRPHLVSHDEIAERLWGRGTHVAAESGIHTAVRKLRRALEDSAEEPRYVETVPGRGYRFIGVADAASDGEVQSALAAPDAGSRGVRATRRTWWWTAAAIAAALVLVAAWSWRTHLRRPQSVTLGVLPFENLTGEPAREYLAEGLTEDVILALGQVAPEHLRVIGRTATRAFHGSAMSPVEIGEALDAAYLVEGSVRAEQGRVRINSALLRVSDQVQVWSGSYDREPGSVLALQRELSLAIAQQIRSRLSGERLAALARRQTHDALAQDLYLRGRYLGNQLTPASNRAALELFQRALDLDPDYALAWSAVADVLLGSPINADVAPRSVAGRAREAAEHAVRLAPDSAETQTSLGGVEFFLTWDWRAAERAFERAVAHDPGYARAHRMLAHVLSQTGRPFEAQQSIERARRLDPFYAMSHSIASQLAFQRRDPVAALAHARQALAIEPTAWIGHVQAGQAHEQLGQLEAALLAVERAGQLSGGNSKALSFRGHLLARSGRSQEARDVAAILEATSRQRYIPGYAIALIYAGLGEPETAFHWLERALAARDVHLIFLPVDPRWDAMRGDPRFAKLIERCGFASGSPSPTP